MHPASLPWSPTAAWGFGWRRFRADPLGVFGPLFVGALLVSALPAAGGLYQVEAQSTGDPELIARAGMIRLGLGLANLPIQAYVLGGLFTFVFKVARGQTYGFADLITGGRWFAPMLGVNIVILVAVTIGLALFIAPGLMVLAALCLAPPLVVDRDLDAVAALKESLVLTEGHRLKLFLYGALATALSLVGYLALCVGSYVAGAVGLVGFVWIYLRLGGQTTAEE